VGDHDTLQPSAAQRLSELPREFGKSLWVTPT